MISSEDITVIYRFLFAKDIEDGETRRSFLG